MSTILDPVNEGFKKATPKAAAVLYKIVEDTQQVNTPDGTTTAHPGDVIVVVGRPAMPESKVRVPVVEVMSGAWFASLYDA